MSFEPSTITDGYLFTWNIENIHFISEERIISPVFITSNLENLEWNMEFFRLHIYLKRIESRRKVNIPEIEVDLSAVSSNGSNYLFTDTKFDKGFHWVLPRTWFDCETLTIHCHMRKPHERNESLIQFSLLTVIQTEHRVGIWKVENFKLLMKSTPKNYALESAGKQLPPIVLTGEKCDKYPDSVEDLSNSIQKYEFKETDEKRLSSIMPPRQIFKIKVTVPDYARYKMIFLICKISCLTEDGEIKFLTERTFFFKYLPLFLSFSQYCVPPDRNSDILLTVKDIDLNNGDLSLICDFIISNGEGKSVIRESSYLQNNYKFITNSQFLKSSITEENNTSDTNIPKEGTRERKHDLKNIQEFQQHTERHEEDLNYEYLNKKYCDVILTTENKTFPVHKCILCLKSPVFKTMFQTDMRETANKKVDIDDLDRDTLCRFLLFLYTEKLENQNWEVATKMYYAADKYQVTSLKSECSSFLKSHLSMSNVCEALSLADLHQDENLKSACSDFILNQNAAKMFSSEKWKDFTVSNPVLSADILQKYFLYRN
ncbi:unnamed protein product [Larinioides sclopetarius]|uniref:BTB domain-containing protein n=1 Tax=Larinioides sclopetarius TaxID=280406 RepID=A0AAV2B5U5_9ARAC